MEWDGPNISITELQKLGGRDDHPLGSARLVRLVSCRFTRGCRVYVTSCLNVLSTSLPDVICNLT